MAGIGYPRAGLGSAATWLALQPAIQDTNLTDTLIADHKRGLLSGQPFDIASSDRQTVKPWFATRLRAGTKGAGPRNTRISARRRQDRRYRGAPTPVLIYRHNEHFISLTALPAQACDASAGFRRRWLFRRGLARRRHRILGYLGHRPGGAFKIPSAFRRPQRNLFRKRTVEAACTRRICGS